MSGIRVIKNRGEGCSGSGIKGEVRYYHQLVWVQCPVCGALEQLSGTQGRTAIVPEHWPELHVKGVVCDDEVGDNR